MKKILAIVACLLVFFSFLTAAIVVHKPLNEEQYQILEQVVYDAYTNEDFLIELPDGIHLTKSETIITADFSRLPTSMTYGRVEGKLVNNEFVVTRVDKTVDTIFNIILMSFCFTGLCAFIFAILYIFIHLALFIASDNKDEMFINLKGVKNVKGFFNRFKDWFDFKKLIALLIVIILFIGNFVLFMHITRPFTEDEWKQTEVIAQNVYNSNSSLIEVPEDFDVSIDEYKIVVSDKGEWSSSTLTATIKNGELVFTRNSGIIAQVLISILCGFTIPFMVLAIIIAICFICELLEPKISSFKKIMKEKRSLKKAEKIKRKTKKNRLK